VVASEVRKFSRTDGLGHGRIQAKVAAIGVDVTTAMAAIHQILRRLKNSPGYRTDGAAPEEQHMAAQEMAHNLERAAHRTSRSPTSESTKKLCKEARRREQSAEKKKRLAGRGSKLPQSASPIFLIQLQP